jgi:hypothetical protein
MQEVQATVWGFHQDWVRKIAWKSNEKSSENYVEFFRDAL